MTILRPGDVPKRVLSADIMDEILESLKVDYILRLPMNLDIFNMSPDESLLQTNVPALTEDCQPL